MAIDMYGNYTPDDNPFAPSNTGSFIANPITGYVPPTMAQQIESSLSVPSLYDIGSSAFPSFDLASANNTMASLFGLDYQPTLTPSTQQTTQQTQTMLSSPQTGQAAGGSNMIQNLLRGAGQYYLGRENIQDVQQLGRETQEQLGLLAEEGREATQFRPYTVTGGLGGVSTTAEGGFGIDLSPEQQALQAQLLGQAQGLFGQVGQDPTEQQAAIYEQIRATQRPEEERQRLALEERMLSQGRLGLSSAAYGGASPELLAQETARQEAMARANVGARQQALSEQRQALAGATGLMTAGYQPQQQALAMLQASATPAGFADVGRRTGQQIAGQLQLGGLESRIQSEQLANQLRLQQQQGLLGAALGTPATPQQQATVAAMPTGSLKDMAEAALRQQAAGAVGGLFSRIFGGGG
jgi:hypothetical protein